MIWVRRIALGLLALVVFAAGTVYLRSESVLRKAYDVPLAAVAVVSDSASIAEGHRLAGTYGCTSCHGEAVEGQIALEDPMLGRFVAPNLTRVVAAQSDAELERAIRRGVRADGRGTLMMPSAMYQHLSDHDLGAVLAYLRSLPPSDGPATEIKPGPMARVGLAVGLFAPQTRDIDAHAVPPSDRPTGDVAAGEYLALTACSECHGQDLTGGFQGQAPDLAVAASYSEAEFAHFLETGEALGGRELETMSTVSRSRFRHFTGAEVRALHAFLRARAAARRGAATTASL